jgi:hypothetical protein
MNEPTKKGSAAASESSELRKPSPADAPLSTRDSGTPEFWDEHFRQKHTPWDRGGVQGAFRRFASRTQRRPVLIPGCGSAHEALWLAQNGWTVRAIDFSMAAVAAARDQLGALAPLVEQADFFTYRPPFDPGWIYERAFFCALPPARRREYVARMADLLVPGGLLAGFFYFGEADKGPPFGIARPELAALCAPYFDLIEDEAVDDSLPVFAGRERWLTWCRS